MEKILSAREMKLCEQFAINEIGIPSEVLMERAAFCVYSEIVSRFDKNADILILAGAGNNGADGIAVGRMLFLSGYKVCVNYIGEIEAASKENLMQYKIAENLGIDFILNADISRFDVVVDALFGIGLSRNMSHELCAVVDSVNNSDCYVVSVDIPSGVDSSSGKIYSVAVKADLTVTFGYKKIGHILFPGADYVGKLAVADIGLPECTFNTALSFTNYDLSLLAPRNQNSNKGTYGKVLIVAGCENMAGAAYLSAKAAYRTGAGLVKVFTHEKNRQIIQTLIPEAVLATYSEDSFAERLENAINDADVIVAGPGMGTSVLSKNILESILDFSKVPTVLDADALNIISENPDMLSKLPKKVIITPHVKEMSRLVGDSTESILDDFIDTAKGYAKENNVTCVLKSARTVTALPDSNVYINQIGNSGMSTAGSGDVLTGIIAGVLTQGVPFDVAAPLGVYIHALAGNKAKETKSERSMIASDIVESLSFVI